MKFFQQTVVKTDTFQESKKAKGYLRGRLGKGFVGVDVGMSPAENGGDGVEWRAVTSKGSNALFEMNKNWDTFR